MEKHLKILGILYIVSGAFSLVGAAIFGLMFTGAGLLFGDLGMFALFSGVGLLVGGFFAVTGIPGIIGGAGLLRRRPWARTLLLVLGVLHILGMAGILLGAYTLWVLFQPETVRLLQGEVAVG
jgi:hypothetical protein